MDSISETSRRVHALVDRLPPSQVAALEGLLQSMIDPGAAGGPEHIEELVEPDRGTAGGLLQFLLQLWHVVIAIPQAPRLGQSHAVNDAGMVQFIGNDRVFGSQ